MFRLRRFVYYKIMNRIVLAGCMALLAAGAAGGADEEALVAWLARDGARVRATAGGYVLQGPQGGTRTLTRTSDGFRLVDAAGRSILIRRTPDGFIARGASPTAGFRARETAGGGAIVTTPVDRATVRRTADGYRVFSLDGPAATVRRTANGLVAAPAAPRDAGLREAFDAAYRKRKSK